MHQFSGFLAASIREQLQITDGPSHEHQRAYARCAVVGNTGQLQPARARSASSRWRAPRNNDLQEEVGLQTLISGHHSARIKKVSGRAIVSENPRMLRSR